MEFTTLIKEVGDLIGIEDFQPDEKNYCELVSEVTTTSIQFMPEHNAVLIYAPLMVIPQDVNPKVLWKICHDNFLYSSTRGAMFSIDPETSTLYLSRYDLIYNITADKFYQHLMSFATVMQNSLPQLSELLMEGTEDANREAEAEKAEQLGENLSFMKV